MAVDGSRSHGSTGDPEAGATGTPGGGRRRRPTPRAHTEIAGPTAAEIASLSDAIRELHAEMRELRAEMGTVTALLDARIQYLTARVDAYADVDDTVAAGLGDRLDRHEVLLVGLERSVATLRGGVAADVERIAANEFRQAEQLDALRRMLDLRAPLPPTRQGAASPDLLVHLHRHILERRPRTIVQLGSGVATIVMAAALRANGAGVLHCLEHGGRQRTLIDRELVRHGLDGRATVHDAPLGPWTRPQQTPPEPTAPAPTPDEALEWYREPEALASIDRIDLLVVEGPRGRSGTESRRYPALPHYRDRLAPSAQVLVDDVGRPAEQRMVEAWRDAWRMQLAVDRGFEKALATLRPLDDREVAAGAPPG